MYAVLFFLVTFELFSPATANGLRARLTTRQLQSPYAARETTTTTTTTKASTSSGRRQRKRMSPAPADRGRMVPLVTKPEKLFVANLSAAQEVDKKGIPAACRSIAIGNAVASLQGHKFCINLSYGLGFSLPETASHIHGPALFGQNGPPILTLSKDLRKTDCFKIKNKQRKQLISGRWYFNIHSPRCPGGEIRGQIIPATIDS